MTGDELHTAAARLVEGRREQDLSEHVEDAHVLGLIASVLRELPRPRRGRRRAGEPQ
jgi:hypothetical protein